MHLRLRYSRFFLFGALMLLLSFSAPFLKNDLFAGYEFGLANQSQAQALQESAPIYQFPGTNSVSTAVSCEDTDCPTGQPAGLDKCVERENFCIYYDTDSITESEAETAADTVQNYWDRFVELGFNEPKYTDKLRVELPDISPCNGGTGWSTNAMDTYTGCFDIALQVQNVLGHELTHRMQYAYDNGTGAPIQTKFLKEGTARATEDNWFTEIDNWADALSTFSFNSEANNYLLATQNDITSVGMRYMSALWWKYGMEQYGTIITEPQRGIDFIKQVLQQNTAGYSGIAAVNQALSVMGTGSTFDESFKQFGVAIYTKDLTGLPDASYNFIDEEEPGNAAVYGPLDPNGGSTIQMGTSDSWIGHFINPYSLRYYQANVGANCPVVSANFHKRNDGPAFYHVVTQNGSTFLTHKEGSGPDWTQAFMDEDITRITAIVGSLGNSSQVDISLSCANPVVDVKMPNDVAVARVQPGTRFLAQVLVTDGSPAGPVVTRLTNEHFQANVGGLAANIVGGGFIQEQYWLLIDAPNLSDGAYDLEISLQEPGGAVLASDTNPSSVVYSSSLSDQVLIIDRSGSMGVGDPQRLLAAKDAAAFYVDVTRDGDGLSVVPYNGNVSPVPFALAKVDDTVQTAAKSYINALTPLGMTSIGNGLKEAVSQLKASDTGNEFCSLVLLSDGMENTPDYWADVRTQVIDSGCPVTTIAFGPETDETLLQTIASETGGLYFYNDVFVSTTNSANLAPEAAVPTDMALDLGNTYEYAQSLAEFRQRLLVEKGVVSEKEPGFHKVLVDETISEIVFSLDWAKTSNAEIYLYLWDPNGKKYTPDDPGYSFEDSDNSHVGYRIEKFVPGEWLIEVVHNTSKDGQVPYQVLVSARSKINLELLLPDRLGLKFETGNQVPIYAILSGKGPIADAQVTAWVTGPDGNKVLVHLLDDGQHGDGASGDGLYAGVYTAVNQAEQVLPSDEKQEQVPYDEGSYQVLVRATHKTFQREALGAFSVLEGFDGNGNRIPDVWEKENDVTNLEGDPDMDNLINYLEYTHGTDPNDPDSDDGGEKDGSEVSNGRDPLDPSDDMIARPDFIQVQAWKNAVILRYDFKPDYDYMRLYRATNPSGPWQQVDIGLPETGIYTDTAVINNQQYFYRTEGIIYPQILTGEDSPEVIAAVEIVSSVLTSEGVTPSADPILPEAHVLINQDDPITNSKNVHLSFIPYESEGEDAMEAFEDITEIMISNTPDFSGAIWQPFTQGIPWVLDADQGDIGTVYVRFRDKSGNLSISPESDSILYQMITNYLPIITK